MQRIGRLIYVLNLPIFRLLLNGSSRSRVIILSGDEILLVKNLLSEQLWRLPGGGIGRKETPVLAAIREIKEELGVKISSDKIKKLATIKYQSDRNVKYNAEIFFVRVDKNIKPSFSIQSRELADMKWHKLHDLPSSRHKLVDRSLELLDKSEIKLHDKYSLH